MSRNGLWNLSRIKKILDTPLCCVTTFENTLYTNPRPDASTSRSQLSPGAFGRADPPNYAFARATIESRVRVQSCAIFFMMNPVWVVGFAWISRFRRENNRPGLVIAGGQCPEFGRNTRTPPKLFDHDENRVGTRPFWDVFESGLVSVRIFFRPYHVGTSGQTFPARTTVQ